MNLHRFTNKEPGSLEVYTCLPIYKYVRNKLLIINVCREWELRLSEDEDEEAEEPIDVDKDVGAEDAVGVEAGDAVDTTGESEVCICCCCIVIIIQ